MNRLASLVGLGLLAMACGASSSSSGDDDSDIITSKADLCAGAAPETSDHLVTAVSCPWVQHTDNVQRFGELLATKQDLLDATGAKAATISNTCEGYALGGKPDLGAPSEPEAAAHAALTQKSIAAFARSTGAVA